MCKRCFFLVLAIPLVLGACKRSEEPAPADTQQEESPPTTRRPTEEERQAALEARTRAVREAQRADLAQRGEALQRSRAAAERLGRNIKARLLQAMNEGGPVEAARVCSEEAREITRSITQITGIDVGRTSLRLRNPDNAPRPWVDAWLQEQGERRADTATGYASVDDGHARVILPIAVEPMCVTCHGAREQLHPDVAAVLAEKYPQDAAFGYRAGDLRGALWAEQKLPPVE